MTGLTFSADTGDAKPLYLVSKDGLEDWLAGQPEGVRSWVTASDFKANAGAVVLLPEGDGVAGAVGGLGSVKDRARKRFVAAGCRGKLPEGVWRFETDLDAEDLAEAALGWLLAGYRFDRFASGSRPKAELVAPEGVDAARLERIARGRGAGARSDQHARLAHGAR